MTYQVKFRFDGTRSPFELEMVNQEKTLAQICDHLVSAKYQTFIDGNNAVIVNLSKVATIEVEEVR